MCHLRLIVLFLLLLIPSTSMAAIFSLMCDELVLTLRTVKLAPAVLKWLSKNESKGKPCMVSP